MTTTYAIIDLTTADEISRSDLERAIIDLAESLYSEPLGRGQAEDIADEMRVLQGILDDLDACAPGWGWLHRISTMEEPPENVTEYIGPGGVVWDLT